MKNLKNLSLALLLAIGPFSATAQAGFVLDTGVPDNSKFPLVLDAANFVAAEFSLAAGQTNIHSIQAYLNGGNSGMPGDQFTVALYSADGSGNLPGTALWTGHATFQADGWNGLDNVYVSGLTAGNYWVALEVGSPNDTAGLLVPVIATGGSAPASAYAFNAGSGYDYMTGENFGVRVTVPEPATVWLFGVGLLPFAFHAHRRANNA
jgi:hypothetical protein